ncbi:hypothetical protein JDV02_007388 [Purpureocillium takamizusanense]|uniref:BRCT domain-containing protein n=1 Tax=Purpureocillium takamizusanense TaxID=2060973 RepID=A0A9Q8VE02_9HYPO|nr:uncharacterized protein JDV02_007388 [Purpureocillium takamizusanense]UNI21394.1 hypothetical protein JDV02_007388 [Purpureocillium takamizusanense]
MPRQIFKNKVIAVAGPLPGDLTVENLRRWTSLRRGQFVDDFDETVTHLLCTEEQFNKRAPRVKEALKRGNRAHIVHFDWFEISAVNEKRQHESEYSMRDVLAKKNAARRERERVERGKREGERFVNTNLYHIYSDRMNFYYQFDIRRDDESLGEQGQRYQLCLWESNAKPHLYWFTAKFLKRKGDSQPTYHRPSPHSGKWRHEMDLMTDFFRKKTGVAWEDRVLLHKTMPSSFFQYTPPTGGKSVGRRLSLPYEDCLQKNAELRGLPWPPPEETQVQESTELDSGEEDGPRPLHALDEHEAGDGDQVSSPTTEAELPLELAAPLTPESLAGERSADADIEMDEAEMLESASVATPDAGPVLDQDVEMPTPPEDVAAELD